jgi:phosphatidylglycerol lysyltransferase
MTLSPYTRTRGDESRGRRRERDPLALVREHGRSSTSFQILVSDVRHFVHEHGCVGYRALGDVWVALGGPIAPPEHEDEVARAFVAEARRQRMRARLFGVEGGTCGSEAFARTYVGEQPIYDPRAWPECIAKRVRAQLRRDRARALVDVREVPALELLRSDSAVRGEIERVLQDWTRARAMARMTFMVEHAPFVRAEQRRYFVAELGGRVVAVLIAMPVFARRGWFIETLLRSPSAPTGTMEMILDGAMRAFAAEGVHHVTLGLCPLSRADDRTSVLLRKYTCRFYNFDGLRKFKEKLGPVRWEPVYLAYPADDAQLLALYDASRAFLPHGVLRFGLDTLAQQTRPVAAGLSVLLALVSVTHALVAPAAAAGLAALALQAGLSMLLAGYARRPGRRLALAASWLAAVAAAAHGAGALTQQPAPGSSVALTVIELVLLACASAVSAGAAKHVPEGALLAGLAVRTHRSTAEAQPASLPSLNQEGAQS